MTHIIVVGQTPPPFGGQGIMIAKMLEADYGEGIRLHHVRMVFSRDMDEIGKFRPRKLVELCRVIFRIVEARLRTGASILYYPPAGPNRAAIYRDLAILLATRWLFRRTIFHFHAGGVSSSYRTASPLLKLLMRMAYFQSDIAIRLSELAPDDGEAFQARKEYIVPNGIEDNAHLYQEGDKQRVDRNSAVVLFVGVLNESKGVMTLLAACRWLAAEGLNFRVKLMGRFESDRFEKRMQGAIVEYGLEDYVMCLGVLTGTRKWEEFASADTLCFPTYFESETFGVVLLEAMSFGLPIVATRWRGIPSVVEDRVTGFLVPIRDPGSLAKKLKQLVVDPGLRRAMGEQGRRRFLERFTLQQYHESMKQVFLAAAQLER